MAFNTLDSVVLTVDHPESGLRAGDMGTVVEVYGEEAAEVEFVRVDGNTHAVVTLPVTHLRPLSPSDLPTVRRAGGAAAA
jgi:hypothetical protein